MGNDRKYSMGIDVGVASLGVALVEYDTGRILDGCARVYPASIGASERRQYASMRRQYVRRRQRKNDLKERLAEYLQVPKTAYDTRKPLYRGSGIVASGFSAIALRNRGISECLDPTELARALYHIAHNRGSRLERPTTDDQDAKDESSKTRDANRLMQQELSKHQLKTVGQYLYRLMQQGRSTRGKKDADGAYNFYITRQDMKDELNALLEQQQQHHPSLSDEVITKLKELIFYEEPGQSPLKLVGTCCYGCKDEEGTVERRLAKGSSLFQEKRLLEEINNLRIRYLGRLRGDCGRLCLEERDAIYRHLQTRKEAGAAQMKKAAGICPAFDLSVEDTYKRKSGKGTERKIAGNDILYKLKSKFKSRPRKKLLESIWQDLDQEQRTEVESILRDERDLNQFDTRLKASLPNLDLSDKEIEELYEIRFVAGYGAAGISATRKLIEHLRADVIDLKEAERLAGLKHVTAQHQERRKFLPYYGQVIGHYCAQASKHPDASAKQPVGGAAAALNEASKHPDASAKQPVGGAAAALNEASKHPDASAKQPVGGAAAALNEASKHPAEQQFGKIANPVVHRSLNQIRQVVNTYIKQYGAPQEIVVELSRDLGLSADERDRLSLKNKENQKLNREYDDTTTRNGKRPSRKYRRALKLHKWQKGTCPYTGQSLSVGDIFNGDAEIDHILPHSRTMDDSMSNLVLCLTAANQQKRERSPHQAFSAGDDFNLPGKGKILISWGEILVRIEKYPESKKRRFNEDAMDRYKDENVFLKRYESDTRYLAKVASQYLRVLFDPDDSSKVRVLAGGITGEMRHAWGLGNVLADVLEQEQSQAGTLAGTATTTAVDETAAAVAPQNHPADKKREDSRHHIVDAITIACISWDEIDRLHKLRHKAHSTRLFYQQRRQDPAPIAPWPNFRNQVKGFISDPKRVVQKRARDPMGELHQQTSYAAIAWRKKDKQWICSQRKDLLTAMIGGVNSKSHPPASIWTVLGFEPDGAKAPGLENIVKELGKIRDGKIDGKLYWKSSDPCLDMESIIANLRAIGQAIEELYYQQPDFKVKPKKESPTEEEQVELKPKDKLRLAVKQYQQQPHAAKGFNRYETGSLRELGGATEGEQRPPRLYKPAANSHMDVYIGANGKPGWEIIQRLDAVIPTYQPKWKRLDANAKLLFTLRKDDELEIIKDPKEPVTLRKNDKLEIIKYPPKPVTLRKDDELEIKDTLKKTDSDPTKIIVRVQKLSAGDLMMFPVEKATSRDASPHKIRDRSIGRFLSRKPRLLVRDPCGKVLWRSPLYRRKR